MKLAAFVPVRGCPPVAYQQHTCQRRTVAHFRFHGAVTFVGLVRCMGFHAADSDRIYYRLNEQGNPISHPNESVAYGGFRVFAVVQSDLCNPAGWRPVLALRNRAAMRSHRP